MRADQAGADVWSGEKYGAGRAVIGAEGVGFFDAAAEFAEGEDDDAVVELGEFQIVQKGFERAGEFAEERSVRVDLRGVRVVAGLGDVINAGLAAEFEKF